MHRSPNSQTVKRILASGLVPKQDLTAHLMVLFAAIRQHGVPEMSVSDSGRVFRAKQAAVWPCGVTLTVAFADEPLAQYQVRYQPNRRQLSEVSEPRLFETPFRSPHMPLWELGDGDWLKIVQRPPYRPRRTRREQPQQQTLVS